MWGERSLFQQGKSERYERVLTPSDFTFRDGRCAVHYKRALLESAVAGALVSEATHHAVFNGA